MKTLPLGPFLGENNRLPDFALHVDKVGDFLRNTLNVDVDDKGNVRRRAATKLIQALTGAHSLHMVSATTGYVAIASVIYAITLPTYSQTLFKVLTTSDPISWVTFGDNLYYSNGTDSGRITAGVWYPLGLPTPASPPLALIHGALLPGWYQVSVSYRASSIATDGEEGGISSSSNIEITGVSGGIRVTLPGALPYAYASHVAIYLSACNGSVPMLATTVPVATATFDLTGVSTGHEAQQRFEAVLPAGELFLSNGRLCSFNGKTAYIGLPHRPGYYLPVEGYIPFPDDVTVAVENQGGTYISTAAQTFWFPGDLGDVQEKLTNPLPYGATRGTAFRFPDKILCGWFGAKGMVFGDIGGQVDAIMADHIDQTAPASGVSVVLESNGYRRVVACGWAVNTTSKAATRYSGWDFDSVSGGFGTMADGIHQLDATGNVPWSVGLGKQNFSTEAFKYLPAVYAGVNCDEPVTLSVELPDGTIYDYDARSASAALEIQRFDLGRGLRANWYGLTLSNATGLDFTLASVSFAATASTRRI